MGYQQEQMEVEGPFLLLTPPYLTPTPYPGLWGEAICTRLKCRNICTNLRGYLGEARPPHI